MSHLQLNIFSYRNERLKFLSIFLLKLLLKWNQYSDFTQDVLHYLSFLSNHVNDIIYKTISKPQFVDLSQHHI